MNGFRIRALQDLSLIPTKSLQHESCVSSNTLKRRFWDFLDFSCKKKSAREIRKVNLSKTTDSNDVEPVSKTQTILPEITAMTLSSQSPTRSLRFGANMENFMKILKLFIKYNELPSLLHENSIPRNMILKVKNYETAKDVNFLSAVKSELKTSDNINQQQSRVHRKLRDDRHSQICDSKLQSRSSRCPNSRCTQESLFSRTTERQQSQITRRVSRTLTTRTPVVARPSPPSFEAQRRSSTGTMMETRERARDAARSPAIFAEIEILRNIPPQWYSAIRPYSRAGYHAWRSPTVEDRAIKFDDRNFFILDIRAAREEKGALRGPFQFDRSVYLETPGNRGSRNSVSRLSSVASSRVFPSKNSTIPKSVRTIGISRKDTGGTIFNANLSIAPLRNVQSHSGDASLTKRSFSCSGPKKPADCSDEAANRCGSQRSRCKEFENESSGVCSSTRKKTAADRCEGEKTGARRKGARVRDDACGKRRRRNESKPCERYLCPELNNQIDCNFEREQCPAGRKKTGRKCDAKGSHARRSRDSACTRERDATQCGKKRRSKSCKRNEDCEKSGKPRIICTDPSRGKNKCSQESKCDDRCQKRETRGREQQKCAGSNRRRSSSCQKKSSSPRAGGRSCCKSDDCSGKRYYSQQSFSTVLQDHRRSLSSLTPDIVLDTDATKATRRFYASCIEKPKSGPTCEKPKKKCETKKQDKNKKKCDKGPAKCLTRKSVADRMQACSAQKNKEKKALRFERKPSKCSHEEYCANRKKFMIKDKKPKEESMKEKIDREFKEIDECKKNIIKDKDAKSKQASPKMTALDRVISPCKQWQTSICADKEADFKCSMESFKSTPNEPNSSNSTDITDKALNLQSRIVHSDLPIIIRDVKLFNVMFDRSLYTKAYHQDDFAIKRAADRREMRRDDASNGDFIHGDELPLFIEIENNDEEEADNYDPAANRFPISIDS